MWDFLPFIPDTTIIISRYEDCPGGPLSPFKAIRNRAKCPERQWSDYCWDQQCPSSSMCPRSSLRQMNLKYLMVTQTLNTHKEHYLQVCLHWLYARLHVIYQYVFTDCIPSHTLSNKHIFLWVPVFSASVCLFECVISFQLKLPFAWLSALESRLEWNTLTWNIFLATGVKISRYFQDTW